MPSFQDLPPEIATSICEYLPRSALRNIRQTRVFDDAARRVLFRKVYLKVNLSSFERLSNISKHETLRHYVELVEYAGVEFDRISPPSYSEWLLKHAASGLGIKAEKRDAFLTQFTEKELRNFHFNHCAFLAGQDRLLEGDNEIKWLRQALQKFSRLSIVALDGPECHYDNGIDLQPLSTFHHVAREILVEPLVFGQPRIRHFGRFLQAVSSIEKPGRVKEIRVAAQNHDDFETLHEYLPNLDLEDLEVLSLEFWFDSGNASSDNVLRQLLRHVSGLQGLRLSYREGPVWQDFPITAFPDSSFHWDSLKYLCLRGVVTTLGQFQALLERHSATLQTLELFDITLHVDSITPIGGDRVPWITIIHMMSEVMSLQCVKFSGFFGTNTNENWTASSKHPITAVPRTCHEVCMMDRIEQFIIHGGSSPFTPKNPEYQPEDDLHTNNDEEVVPDWTPHYSWSWEEDDTWRWDESLIDIIPRSHT